MSQSSLKSRWWKYLWLNSEVPLILFILFNLGASALTGWFTPKLVTSFYESLKNEADFSHYAKLLIILYCAEYVNRFLYQLSTHRYIQILLTDIRRESFSLWLKAPFK